MQKIDRIQIYPYTPIWPIIFEQESCSIKKALGVNCTSIYHVGSTSVPGLASKPKIDIIAVVTDLLFDKALLEALGYEYRGGFSIPLRRSFTLREPDKNINLHVFEENDPEIELNILFREYLCKHLEVRDEYAQLKYNLIKQEACHKKNDSLYRGYTLEKHAFIANILEKTGFKGDRFVLATHYSEWDAVRALRKKYFFDSQDPNVWTFNHPQHAHLILYQGIDIIGYAHVEFEHNHQAIIKMIEANDNTNKKSIEIKFLTLIQKWFRITGHKMKSA